MSVIIAGHFRSQDEVRLAVGELARRDFAASEYAAYFREPNRGIFDLADALFGPDTLAGGPMVAVCVDRPGTEAAAILLLSRCGAWEIERAEGVWQDGGWRDYDPDTPREILKEIPGAPGHGPETG
ncbi:MAG TPA: hypothetical protein VFF03_01425 [Rhodocyclaceae bacterium]|nr:hypothetical protein [Rhodocyclaceae bacterium]